MVNDALRTADRFGHLMPSYCGTETAELMQFRGLVEPDPLTGNWPKLTAAGWAERERLFGKHPHH